MDGSSSANADTIGQNAEEETQYGLFRWPRYLNGRAGLEVVDVVWALSGRACTLLTPSHYSAWRKPLQA
jgi:hypothetical protein